VKGVPAGGDTALAGSIYIGPKEYRRLANTAVFKADQDKVMDFGFFKYFSQILLTLMTWIHGWTHNWGIAIILTTLTLKTIFIPFTLAASKSAKRMAKIQPDLQAIREKYKDNPQKQQQATMELFKSRKINPVGGCFPILITIPFFMGFFTMLQSAAELRFSPFLWAYDLSATDTVAHIWIFPLRIMPLLMGATMVIQMHLTPSPSVDNMQMKMMKFMPYIFTFFCYNFSCALSLYSFINGLFTIGQQLVINRMKDPVEPAPAPASGKPVKNVTPKKSLK
jgi:YidC/Oxa1 family membrane protein insertase